MLTLGLSIIANITYFLPFNQIQGWQSHEYGQIIDALLIAFFLAVCVVFFTIPLTIHFCKKYSISDKPDDLRKSHTCDTPNLGGFNIFLGLFLSFTIFGPSASLEKFRFVFLALFLLLVVGIWDDTRPLNPWIKMIWQLVAAIIMIVLGETYLSDLFGLFGFENLSMSMSYIISILLTLTIINGINLLDGINGLSATLTIILSFFFFFWFLSIQHYVLALFSCTLCAATIAFLWYNWTPASIFMGDSGAMILGLSISFLTLSFLQTDSEMIASKSPFAILHAPKIVVSALLLPIIDTTRVFFIRLLDGTSPLSADRNHLHHKFVDAGYSDVQTTLILSGCQLGLILIALGTIRLSYLNSFMIMSICLLGVYLFFSEVLKKAEGTG